MSAQPNNLFDAQFNPKIKTYLLVLGIIICVASVVGIVLLPFWLLIAPTYLKRYFELLECQLTTRALRFKKGYIFQTERTIPLDKIQDLTFKEGPVLKYFELSILKVETAGGSHESGSDLSLIGIIDAFKFRKMVLDQRDKVTDNSAATADNESTVEILKDIRDSLQNIEGKLNA